MCLQLINVQPVTNKILSGKTFNLTTNGFGYLNKIKLKSTHLRGANSPTTNVCNCANIDQYPNTHENSSRQALLFSISIEIFYSFAIVVR